MSPDIPAPNSHLLSNRKNNDTMPTSRGRPYYNTVEIKPSNIGTNIAPSSPPSSPSSPKAVRFAPTSSGLVSGISRPLTPTEAWSLYHFETHAQSCSTCNNPLGVHLKRGRLCDNGHALAQDVAYHVYYYAGDVYSTKEDNHKQVRVELPLGYDQLRGLLKSMDHHIRSSNRTVPIISYDANYPVSARRRAPSPELRPRPRYEDERTEVIIEPANTERDRTSRGHRSKPRAKGYATVVVQDDIDSEPDLSRQPSKTSKERRGSLYEADRQRQRQEKEYLVEIREPKDRDGRRRKEHRKSTWS